MRLSILTAVFAAMNFATPAAALELDFSGSIGIESRLFFQSPRFASQSDASGSFAFQPEFYAAWADGYQSLLFIPFLRLDQNDARRTHADIRELSYIYASNAFELRAGVRKVFWGVAESNHLIDIINQVDFVENIDLEDRLGQPMVNLALIQDWGTLDFFVLPGFRERTFPGRRGRFQGPLRISTSAVDYESAAGDKHVDFAARYSNYFGPFDVGIAHFWGTSRDPRFVFEVSPAGEPILAPFYDIIHQTSIDLQATLANWLLKFEGYRRQGFGDETYVAAIGGFEYTFVGVFGSAADIGALAEYHFDERGRRTPTPFNNDLFVGTRVAMNDIADSQLLGGIISDLDGTGHLLNIEASRRLGNHWKVELELRMFLDVAPNDSLRPFHRDSLVQLEILRYF
ncbi:MAG: hypothetical protein WD928_13900 [Gammaproteobacteria bacterium]